MRCANSRLAEPLNTFISGWSANISGRQITRDAGQLAILRRSIREKNEGDDCCHLCETPTCKTYTRSRARRRRKCPVAKAIAKKPMMENSAFNSGNGRSVHQRPFFKSRLGRNAFPKCEYKKKKSLDLVLLNIRRYLGPLGERGHSVSIQFSITYNACPWRTA